MHDMSGCVSVESIYSKSLRVEHFSGLYGGDLDLSSFYRPDEFGLDAFHHAIIASNPVMMKVLAGSLGEFGTAAGGKLPYLLLASALGHEQLEDDVRKLCEVLSPLEKHGRAWITSVGGLVKDENFKTFLTKLMGEEAGREILRKFELLRSTLPADEGLMSALDLASSLGYRGYVLVFLQKLGAEPSDLGRLSMAAECSSLPAVRLLSGDVPEDNLYRLLAEKVAELKADQAELILKTGLVDPGKRREGTNLYHLACSSRTRHVGLDRVVCLLIDRGFDVNDGFRPGTYPLYSMIYSFVCERDINPKKVPLQHMNSLRAMLRAGADPNFDERRAIRLERLQRRRRGGRGNEDRPEEEEEEEEERGIDGRDPSGSALDCYFDSLQFHEKWNVDLMEQLDQICLLLLEHGADPTAPAGGDSGSPLHSLAKLSACHHAQGHLSADFFSMSRMLLYFGADPDLVPSGGPGCCPLEFYFRTLFDLMGGKIAFDRWMRSGAVSQVAGLLTYMDRDRAAEACGSIRDLMDSMLPPSPVSAPSSPTDPQFSPSSSPNSYSEGFSREVAVHVETTLLSYLSEVPSLQDSCKLALWRALGRRVTEVRRLPLPKRLKDSVSAFFALEI